ncbi:beta-ketoacyl synthase N-terminal-like domain-containing protein [Fimbriiglobus ruber]|uniref:Omega-3 polyunsaturated fatty acid synthase subunit n=1 Tax=Fimbriiglobus ruber TaxID=1908690 RepID=A0A225DLB0_9BACT|nr:beta-ketoacyl synthase N-terminal-like domain-containing protein [Fimbriiglobus ruber]OWK42290.1 omega-3 polyunsaturated fatty acid synthase subunit [Fimbriiglobus ruber]
MPVVERVAIVGVAGRFPGAGADLGAFWEKVAGGIDCGRDVPADRWLLPPTACFDARAPHPDSVYSVRGYYLDPFAAAPDGTNVPSEVLAGLDPLFHLILDVGSRAWRSARTAGVDRRRTGVVLGNICLPTDASSDLAREYLGGRVARAVGAGSQPTGVNPLNRFAAGLPAGLLAKGLGLGGGTVTLDAACASSIYAIKLACDELLAGRADAMLAGGASRPDALYTQMGFAQLRALSPSGTCSPFDARADGLVVGEGAGIFVLKRLSDALRHGDTIHAVICGVGLSNDQHGNLLAPAQEGQMRAMRTAYEQAGWKPQNVDLIECHATGTPVGDAVEFESLRALWGDGGWKPGQCTIGSVKSTVGHLLTGAGAAALTKVLLAFAAKTRPPQANFAVPAPGLRYAGGPFRIPTHDEPWDTRRPLLPRRAAVSGFGFGGVNGHLLIEEYVGQTYVTGSGTIPVSATTRAAAKSIVPTTRKSDPSIKLEPGAGPVPIAVVGMAAHFGPWDTLRKFQEHVLGGTPSTVPAPKRNGWAGADATGPAGYFIEELTAPVDRFRIPPKEIEEMLPQQLLMLTVAAAAIDDCQGAAAGAAGPDAGDPRTGVFVGLGLDPNTTNFHLRWAAKKQATEAAARRDASAGADDTNVLVADLSVESWVAGVADAVSPPLNANRTMGALGSIAASRIARAFHFGGPSFTLCSEETSAARAVELAVRALRSNELDRVIVGGVDLAGDPRAVLSAAARRPFSATGAVDPLGTGRTGALAGEGAAALVLKRLADAERDGDRVYAVIRGVGIASGGAASGVAPDPAAYASSLVRACSDGVVDPGTVDYYDAAATGTGADDSPEATALAALLGSAPRPVPLTIGAVRGQVGQVGAAGAAAGLVKSCLALFHQILPLGIGVDGFRDEMASAAGRCQPTRWPRFWLADAGTGPRRAIVAATGVDGSAAHIVLEEYVSRRPEPAGGDVAHVRPLGARAEAVFAVEADGPPGLLDGLTLLTEWATARVTRPIEYLAREWVKASPPASGRKRAVTFVARYAGELLEQVTIAKEAITARPDSPLPDPSRPAIRDRIFYAPAPVGPKAKVAFVFPGSGNHFAGMGRDLSADWSAVLRRQQAENQYLREQYAPERFWAETIPADTTAAQYLFGQVTLGTLSADILFSLGLRADALIGKSLGESAGLFGLRVWRDRDQMLRRIQKSTLFASDLAPPYDAARAFWNLSRGRGTAVDWTSGVLAAPADDVRAALRPGLQAYLLIVNTPTECVIGGIRADVEKLVQQFGAPYFPLSGVTLAHCEVAKSVEKPYRELHTLPTTPSAGLTVFSGAWGRSYKPTSENAADSITAGLLGTIDFPAVVEAAYKDGVRVFVEVGPGNSCTRMIGAILGSRQHVARAVCAPRQDSVGLVLRCVAQLIAERSPADLTRLYGGPPVCADHFDPAPPSKMSVTVPVGQPAPPIPAPPWIERAESPAPKLLPEPPRVAERLVLPPPVQAPEPVAVVPEPAVVPPVPVVVPEPVAVPEPVVVAPEPAAIVPEPALVEPARVVPVIEDTPPAQPAAVVKASPPVEEDDDWAVPLHGIGEDLTAPPPIPVIQAMTAIAPAISATWAASMAPFLAACTDGQAAVAAAHDAFLRVQAGFTQLSATALRTQSALVSRLLGHVDEGDGEGEPAPVVQPATTVVPVVGSHENNGSQSPPASPAALLEDEGPGAPDEALSEPAALPPHDPDAPPRSLDTAQCFEFARGKIGKALGPLFAEADAFPTRVRLPDGPLMLVDNILSIEGEPRSMKSGRVITDHTVHPGRWYLDAGRCPTSVTVESGQADLFLAGFLGIDFETRGLAVYRLLDAVATFHRGLPVPGETILYDIRIDEFVHQSGAWLFRFRFESTVDGVPLLSMQNGVAGFFTAEALAAGKGIVHTELDKKAIPGKKPADWTDLVPLGPCSLVESQVEALRAGDLVAAFGDEFTRANLRNPLRLPGGMLKLVDRVPEIDPIGGRFGLGFVRAEYDIRPHEWFIECHFVDDKVMPGTLMYECCLHTLRVLLTRLGWVGEDGEVVCEPVPEIGSRLKCRGQVLETTKTVTYEVSIKELGYGPEPFCIADALMYADGKPIVEITNMSLRMTGLTRAKLEAIWAGEADEQAEPIALEPAPPEPVPQPEPEPEPEPASAPVESDRVSPQYETKPAVYGPAQILAYSNGNPSEGFGEPYRVFDHDRVLARLPGPPFQFLDRVTAVTGEPFVLKEGAACEAQYDVPPDAWYFGANRCPRMPFAVLLEIALQPCGWLAAYCGSALTSESDLSFRNLGGKATQFVEVGPDVGTLTVNVKMTGVSKSAGMIIQHFDMKVTNRDRTVYEGTTYFGFFGKAALVNQVGMPAAKVPYITDEQRALPGFETGELPHDPPFPAPMLRMVDAIDGYLPTGGRAGLGLIQGSIAVDPSFWFFQAHFYQDPVWPGSLGLESFLQLLKYAAWRRWGAVLATGWQTVVPNHKHEWTYRGQVVPGDNRVVVVLEVTAVDESARRLTADGFLTVDGRIIYQMTGFTLQ